MRFFILRFARLDYRTVPGNWQSILETSRKDEQCRYYCLGGAHFSIKNSNLFHVLPSS